MANFRLYPGLYIKAEADIKCSCDDIIIKKDEVYQVLGFHRGSDCMGLSGIGGAWPIKGPWSPIYGHKEKK